MSNIELKNNSHVKRKGKVPENQKITSSVEVYKEMIPLVKLAYKHFRKKKKIFQRIEEKMNKIIERCNILIKTMKLGEEIK